MKGSAAARPGTRAEMNGGVRPLSSCVTGSSKPASVIHCQGRRPREPRSLRPPSRRQLCFHGPRLRPPRPVQSDESAPLCLESSFYRMAPPLWREPAPGWARGRHQGCPGLRTPICRLPPKRQVHPEKAPRRPPRMTIIPPSVTVNQQRGRSRVEADQPARNKRGGIPSAHLAEGTRLQFRS